METIEKERTEAAPTSGLALVVICLGCLVLFAAASAAGLCIAGAAFFTGAVVTFWGFERAG